MSKPKIHSCCVCNFKSTLSKVTNHFLENHNSDVKEIIKIYKHQNFKMITFKYDLHERVLGNILKKTKFLRNHKESMKTRYRPGKVYRKRYCRNCRVNLVYQNERKCLFCLTNKTCTKCKKTLTLDSFYKNKNRCKECDKLIRLKKCKKCCESKSVTEFSSVYKRVCKKCDEQKRFCKRCKTFLTLEKFDKLHSFCKNCKNKEKEKSFQVKINKEIIKIKKEKLIKKKNVKFLIQILNKRVKSLKLFEKYNVIKGNFVFCKICNEKHIIITKSHLKMHDVDYDDYIKKYGRDNVYSEFYINLMKKVCKEAMTDDVKNLLSKKSKKFWEENRKEHSLKLKISQNTPKAKYNHIEGIKNYFLYKDTKEKALVRKNNAINSWKDPIVREKRLKSINTFYSLWRRAIGGRNSIKAQAHRRKPTKPQLRMEKAVRNLNYDFKIEREYFFDYYHLDIAIPELKISIECDGDFYHGNPKFYKVLNIYQQKRQKNDKARDTFLRNRDWKSLRFWEDDIMNNLEDCINVVRRNIEEQKLCLRI